MIEKYYTNSVSILMVFSIYLFSYFLIFYLSFQSFNRILKTSESCPTSNAYIFMKCNYTYTTILGTDLIN